MSVEEHSKMKSGIVHQKKNIYTILWLKVSLITFIRSYISVNFLLNDAFSKQFLKM